MIAVDTNVLVRLSVRLLTGDEPKQEAAARSLFASEAIWIAKTGLLETAWVLRSLYGFEESAIHDAFTSCSASRMCTRRMNHRWPPRWHFTTHGIELADAMHLSSRPPEAVFVSFDKSFVQRARRARLSRISSVPVKD